MPPVEVNNRPFQTVHRLQTHRPSTRSALLVVRTNPDPKQSDDTLTTTLSAPAEARYWAEKFGLGANSAFPRSRGKFAHPRAVTLECGGAAVVHQIVVGATATANTSSAPQQQQRLRAAPHQFLLAAVCGPRVPLFGVTPQSEIHKSLGKHSLSYDTSRTVAADRNVPTGGQLAVSASLRSDGRLLAIGTANGTIRVADTTSRATLCQFSSTNNQQNLAIRSVAWFRDGQHLMSAGDDGVVRVWALKRSVTSSNNNSNKPVLELRGHGDSIRCADLWQGEAGEGSLVASGGYDHTVRIWDVESIRSNSDDNNLSSQESNNDCCRYVLQHGAPVEAVLWIKSAAAKATEAGNTTTTTSSSPIWLVSAGGTCLKVWNPISGLCVCTLQAQHRKSITSLLQLTRVNQMEDDSSPTQHRLVTGGLDGLLRIHSWDAMTGQLHYLHGIRIESGSVGITALAATTAGDRIAIGTTAGTILVRQMGPSVPQLKLTKTATQTPRAGTYAFFSRGMNADPTAGDHVVPEESASNKRRKPLQAFDVALQQFRYGDALDAALETRQPPTVAAVLEELGRRPSGLTIALSNRDEESLEPVLAFTARYIARPRYSALLIGVTNQVLDIYGDVAGESETMDELLNKLKNQVSAEVKTQMVLWRIVGQLDSVLTEAEQLS